MKGYYRVMLGRKSIHAVECFAGGFIGTDFGIHDDLSRKLPDEWRAFNKQFIPVFLAKHPDKSKVTAGLACGAIWTVSKGIKKVTACFARTAPGPIVWARPLVTTTMRTAKFCLIDGKSIGSTRRLLVQR
jgi:hypothetical protein